MIVIDHSTDLNFAGAKGNYASHPMHSYAAKFPPQLPRWAIEEFTQKGDKVFDPFVGSGTTLVEARILGRNSYGTEIDPLSRLIAQVKCTLVEELTLLLHVISQARHPAIRDFLYIVFSSIIYTKGKGSMANVMDLAHSRPHRVMKDAPPDVEKAFLARLKRLRKMMEELWAQSEHQVEAKIVGNDARHVPALKTNSMDLVFNSPPMSMRLTISVGISSAYSGLPGRSTQHPKSI